MAASPLSSRPFTGAAVVMGVTGSGKTSVGDALAAALGVPFIEGDLLHPAENVAKMSKGVALGDADRLPWLRKVGAALAGNAGVIASCSALKRSYRDEITRAAGRPVAFIFLDGSRDVLARRLAARRNHFMPSSLLDSQLATLEPPQADERAIALGIASQVDEIAAQAAKFLATAAPEAL